MNTDSDWIIGMFEAASKALVDDDGDDGEAMANNKRRRTLEEIAKIIGVKYEDSAEGCDALVKAIKVRGR
jgi:hypothetical protein